MPQSKEIEHGYEWTFFVGDLTKDVSRQDIFELFSPHGTVEEVFLKKAASSHVLKVSLQCCQLSCNEFLAP